MPIRDEYNPKEIEMLEAWRNLPHAVGWVSDTPTPNIAFPIVHRVATREAVADMGRSLDHKNRLWYDEAYARNSPSADIMVPPFFERYIYSTPPFKFMKVPEEVGYASHFWAGVQWNFHHTIRVGDRFRVWLCKPTVRDVTREDGTGPRIFEFHTRHIYFNQRNEVVSTLERRLLTTIMQTKQGNISESVLSRAVTDQKAIARWPYKYTPQEIDYIEKVYKEEELRGRSVRFWDSVRPGEKLTPIVHGPITIFDDMNTFAAIGMWMSVRQMQDAPGTPLIVVDPDTNISHFEAEWHFDPSFANARGHWGPGVTILQIEHLYGRLLTNWMGDDATLKMVRIRQRGDVKVGDTLFGRGEVTRVYRENDQYLVDINMWLENIRGAVAGAGTATVKLLTSGDVNIEEDV